MIKKLRRKLVAINMVLAMALLLVIFGLVYHFTKTGLEDASITALKAAVNSKFVPGRPGMLDPYLTQPCFTLELSGRGELMASGSEQFDLTDEQTLQNIYDTAAGRASDSGLLSQYDLRYYRTQTPMGIRIAFVDTSAEQRTLGDLVESFIIIGVVAFVGFLGISIWLAAWAVRPVEQAWKQQRQFVADASHELKTPLTVILTNAEMLRSGEYDDKAQFADSIYTVSQRMKGLVESMLDQARVDNGQVMAQQERLNWSALVEETALPFEPVYFEEGLTLESRVEPDIFVTGSQTYLRQVVEILLDNGRKYSTPGGAVTVALARQGRGKCLLTVTTPGTPLSEEACGDIFKRFYRLDSARTTNGSYGLGLSIAQKIMEEHRGKIWAKGGEGCNQFFVQLPEN